MNFNNLFAQLFKDKRGQTIYYHPRSQMAYVVPESEERKVNAFHHRLLLSLAMGAAFFSFFDNQLWGALALFIGMYVATTFWLFRKLLPRFTTYANYKIEQNLPATPERDPRRLLVVGVAYIALGVLLLMTLFFYDNTPLERVLYVVISLMGLGLGFHNLSTYLRFKK
ncbi:MAG: hypothetical protein GX778_06315 [Erysipelothrix sp.]|nr:hypothetical protein [Erysipelothrix sp.]